jgi:hypothetical protein
MKTIVLLFSILICSFLIAQTNPVKFHSYAQNDTLVFEATIDKGWHLYAAHLPNPYEGPLPTELVFNASPDFQLNGRSHRASRNYRYGRCFWCRGEIL